jgi:uncharacterized protein (TIGR00369 family)
MVFYTDSAALYSWITVPEHLCGWYDVVHGGVITTMLDEIMSWSAIHLLKRFILTKSISVDFLKPVYIGKELKVEGRVKEMVSEREAIMEGFLYDSDGLLCAASVGRFALFTAEAIRKMKVFPEHEIENFWEIFKKP